jgi:hypothetical protein
MDNLIEELRRAANNYVDETMEKNKKTAQEIVEKVPEEAMKVAKKGHSSFIVYGIPARELFGGGLVDNTVGYFVFQFCKDKGWCPVVGAALMDAWHYNHSIKIYW